MLWNEMHSYYFIAYSIKSIDNITGASMNPWKQIQAMWIWHLMEKNT